LDALRLVQVLRVTWWAHHVRRRAGDGGDSRAGAGREPPPGPTGGFGAGLSAPLVGGAGRYPPFRGG